MKIGFTGSREGMTPQQHESFKKLLQELSVKDTITEFHHGDCIGADTEAHNIVTEMHIPICLHPPTNPSMRSFCKSTWTRPQKDYLVRNHEIVDETNILIATPATAKEVQRSGTWATIRYARKTRKSLYIIKPDGQVL